MEYALTVPQPWASMVIDGRRTVIRRAFAPKHRGRVWIHAGKIIDPGAPDHGQHDASRFPRGVLLGHVSLDTVVRDPVGGWWLIVSAPRALDVPIPTRGHGALWPCAELLNATVPAARAG